MKQNNAKSFSIMNFLPKAEYSGFDKKIFEERAKRTKFNKNNTENDDNIFGLYNSTENNEQDESDNFNSKDNNLSDSENSNWVQENLLRGSEGEAFVKEILIKIYGEDSVKKEPDYAGYDFIVNTKKETKRIEVKTTIDEKYPFFISINELETADKFKDEYYIYWVIMKNKKNKIYILNDPIITLNIDMNYIRRISDTSLCEIETEEFKVKFKDETIKEMEVLYY